MKRTIKFRAWDKDGEVMYYSDKEQEAGEGGFALWQFDTNTGIPYVSYSGLYDQLINGEHYQEIIGVVPEQELMQFTGLLDKNGKEIYEGDIVKGVVKRVQLLTWDTDENCNTKMGGEVYYNHSGFRLKVIESLCEKERDGMGNYFDFMCPDDGDFDEMEVIGNVFENPNLINLEDINK